MRHRVSSIKTKLSKREQDICLRLKEARETAGYRQKDLADFIGIPEERISSYEKCRAPLKHDIALRICRFLIISEEWLATGSMEAIIRAGKKQKIPLLSKESSDILRLFYMRQCMDLLSEPVFTEVPPNTLFSKAYDEYLKPVYEKLIEQFFYDPRIIFKNSDRRELMLKYLEVFFYKRMQLLENMALEKKSDSGEVCRSYLRCLFEIGNVIFKRHCGFSTPEVKLDHMEWLQAIAQNPDIPIGPLSRPHKHDMKKSI